MKIGYYYCTVKNFDKSLLFSHKESTKQDIVRLHEENKTLKLSLKQIKGKAMRMENEIDLLTSRCKDLQLRSMNQNILIYILQEERGEYIYKLLSDILVNSLKTPEQLLHSEKHHYMVKIYNNM